MSGLYPEYDARERRWYRKVGGCIEYEPEIVIDGISVPQSQLQSFRESRKKADVTASVVDRMPVRDCPFKTTGINTECNSGCAWYDKECILTRPEAPQSDFYRMDGKCPISGRKCTENCSMRAGEICLLLKGVRQ